MTTDGIWSYAMSSGHVEGQDLTGCTVVARDGALGHVDRQADPHGMRHLVVDSGVWLFGWSAVVPAGVVAAVDTTARKVSLACTRDEVKAAPRFRTDSETQDPAYLSSVGDYYLRLMPRGTTTG